jgi:hypothetical protein
MDIPNNVTPNHANGSGGSSPPPPPIPPKPDLTIPKPLANPSAGLTAGPVTTAPPVPGGADSPGKGSTAVNTSAMKTFAQNLGALVDPDSGLAAVLSKLSLVDVRAGGFPTAAGLGTKINGDAGLEDGVKTAIQGIMEAIRSAADGVNGIANKYDSIEAANNMTADQYSGYLGQATAEIQQLGGSGAGGSGSGSSGGSGSGSSGGSGSGSSGGSGSGSSGGSALGSGTGSGAQASQ